MINVRIAQFIKENRGQAMVEMALVLPLLLLLLFGIMECGRLFASYIEVEHATRDGARYAAVHSSASDDDIKSVIIDKCVLVSLNDSDITVAESTENGDTWKKITVDFEVDIITPLIGDLLGDTVELTSTMAMRIE